MQWCKIQTGITTIFNTLSTFRDFDAHVNQVHVDPFHLLTYPKNNKNIKY